VGELPSARAMSACPSPQLQRASPTT
jgi:hypothetical protein